MSGKRRKLKITPLLESELVDTPDGTAIEIKVILAAEVPDADEKELGDVLEQMDRAAETLEHGGKNDVLETE